MIAGDRRCREEEWRPINHVAGRTSLIWIALLSYLRPTTIPHQLRHEWSVFDPTENHLLVTWGILASLPLETRKESA